MSNPPPAPNQAAISVPPGLRIELQPRGLNDTTFRLAHVDDYQPPASALQNHQHHQQAPLKLREGMYLMAAIQGRTRISFFKLAENVVRMELDKLQNSGSDYILLVSETSSSFLTLPVHPPPQFNNSNKRPLPAPPISVAAAAAITTPVRAARQPLSPDRSLDEEDEGEEEEYEEDASSFTSEYLRQKPEAAILESVERLRAQRRAVEQIKRESFQKGLRIEALQSELDARAQEMAELMRENDELKRTAWQTSVREDELEQERERYFQLEVEMNALRAQTKAKEDVTAAQLLQEKRQLAEARQEWTRAVEERELENRELKLRLEEASKALSQANLEREASEAREEAARRTYERMGVDQREKEVKLEHVLERTRQERDRILKRAEELDLALQSTRNLAGNHRDALEECREKLFASNKLVEDLQLELGQVRLELEERETAAIAKHRQYEAEMDGLKHEVEVQLAHVREAKEERDAERVKLEEEIRAHRATKEELVKTESLRREAVDAMDRAQRHAKASTERLNEMTKAKDVLHDRLVRALEKGNALADEVEQERLAGKALAETRLELLAQFVEEERRLDGALFSAGGLPTSTTSAAALPTRKASLSNIGRGRLEFASPGGRSLASSTSHSVSYTPLSAHSYASAKNTSYQSASSRQAARYASSATSSTSKLNLV